MLLYIITISETPKQKIIATINNNFLRYII